MSDQPQLPHIECPVRGVHQGYTMAIAGSKDSTEIKYLIRGVWRLATKEIPIIVLGIGISSECPSHVHVMYVEEGGDGILKTTYGNDIVPIDEPAGLSASVSKAESVGDMMDVLHHGYSLYIKDASRKTYTYHAVGVNKGVRGNAYYKLHRAWREKYDNLIHVEVHDNKNPDNVFELTAKSMTTGQWHRVPGRLCPVEGPDPDEA